MTGDGDSFGNLSAGGIARLAYGDDRIPVDDPAESYHEASKVVRGCAVRQAPGVGALETDPAMRERTTRAVRRYRHRPSIDMRGADALTMPLGEALAARRSARDFSTEPLGLEQLAGILEAGYGLTERSMPPFRAVPSGGALYPLELYVFALDVDGLGAGVFHFDPLARALEEIERRDVRRPLSEALIHPELAERAAVFVAITALFWRTRFKYGLRGYRFSLIEAGHVVQNALLAATALDLAAVPVGGYYDRRLDRLLNLDGVTESTIYGIAIGRAK